jgi:hypothetical protein
MSIGPTEIDRGDDDVADLGIDAIRLVTGPSRIGCRIHTISGVDRSDFHVDRIDSATLATDRMISAEPWCERFGAVSSIVPTPLSSCDDPISPNCTVLNTRAQRAGNASTKFKCHFNFMGRPKTPSIILKRLLSLSACRPKPEAAQLQVILDLTHATIRNQAKSGPPAGPTFYWRNQRSADRTASRRKHTGTGEGERCSIAARSPAGATDAVRHCRNEGSVAFCLDQEVP